MKSILFAFVFSTLALGSTFAQRGMPAENRETIHALLAAHAKVKRDVKVTEEGYTATTTSEDKEVAAMLQKHVGQMEARMKKGLMVRRWDPAYVEFVNHYDDIEIKIKKIDNGVRVVATGKTEDARKVARNHAGIITKLVAKGMEEAHKAHAVALGKDSGNEKKTAAKGACCLEGAKEGGKESGCCEGKAGAGSCCKKATESTDES